MRLFVCGLAMLGLACMLTVGAQAGDKDKEVTLKGKICCAKCELALEGQKKCATVVVVKKDNKDVTYWFDAKSDKEHHSKICNEAKDGSVKGIVTEKDKKKTIAVKELKFD